MPNKDQKPNVNQPPRTEKGPNQGPGDYNPGQREQEMPARDPRQTPDRQQGGERQGGMGGQQSGMAKNPYGQAGGMPGSPKQMGESDKHQHSTETHNKAGSKQHGHMGEQRKDRRE